MVERRCVPDDTDQVSRRSHPTQLILKLIINSVEAMRTPQGIARVVCQHCGGKIERHPGWSEGFRSGSEPGESLTSPAQRGRSCLTSWISSAAASKLAPAAQARTMIMLKLEIRTRRLTTDAYPSRTSSIRRSTQAVCPGGGEGRRTGRGTWSAR